jgi:hypothetical protein
MFMKMAWPLNRIQKTARILKCVGVRLAESFRIAREKSVTVLRERREHFFWLRRQFRIASAHALFYRPPA